MEVKNNRGNESRMERFIQRYYIKKIIVWIPAFAGMTRGSAGMTRGSAGMTIGVLTSSPWRWGSSVFWIPAGVYPVLCYGAEMTRRAQLVIRNFIFVIINSP
ncbi:MAG: hypothetical protein WEC80_00255 [Patescibacteria group bacterium]